MIVVICTFLMQLTVYCKLILTIVFQPLVEIYVESNKYMSLTLISSGSLMNFKWMRGTLIIISKWTNRKIWNISPAITAKSEYAHMVFGKERLNHRCRCPCQLNNMRQNQNLKADP